MPCGAGAAFGLDERLLALDEALARLEGLDERAAKVVELRFFGGLSEACRGIENFPCDAEAGLGFRPNLARQPVHVIDETGGARRREACQETPVAIQAVRPSAGLRK